MKAVKQKAAEMPFLQFIADFWKPGSPYILECRDIKKKTLSVAYIKNNERCIRLHIAPFSGFKKITLQELKAGTIRDWQAWCVKRGMSARRINACKQAMSVAYAVKREDFDRNPFLSVDKAIEPPKEKGVLSQGEAAAIIHSAGTGSKAHLAVLLGLLCGMRRGEVRGLQWGDIKDGIIHLQHNWIDKEGMKQPKCGSVRQVPYTEVVQAIEVVQANVRHKGDNDLVFESDRDGIPLSGKWFQWITEKELVHIGISKAEQKARNIIYHSLRHSFITLARLAGVSDLEGRAIAGHTNERMQEHYTHAGQVLDFAEAKRKLEAVGA